MGGGGGVSKDVALPVQSKHLPVSVKSYLYRYHSRLMSFMFYDVILRFSLIRMPFSQCEL